MCPLQKKNPEMDTGMDIADRLKIISQLLHGINNHAVVVCGQLEMHCNRYDLSTKLISLLLELSREFGGLQKDVSSIKVVKKPSGISIDKQ